MAEQLAPHGDVVLTEAVRDVRRLRNLGPPSRYYVLPQFAVRASASAAGAFAKPSSIATSHEPAQGVSASQNRAMTGKASEEESALCHVVWPEPAAWPGGGPGSTTCGDTLDFVQDPSAFPAYSGGPTVPAWW